MTRTIAGPGTPEAVWQADDRLWSLPEVVCPAGAVTVVAAHPDDEVLGVGGLLANLADRVRLVVLTDGEGSHPGSPTCSPDELAHRRLAETHEARAALGLGDAPLVRGGLPDSGLAAQPAACRRVIAGALADAQWCLAPWRHDGHPDHDAAGAAAAAVCADRGIPLLEYPIWLWHWGEPGLDVPWESARGFRLDERSQERKRRAASLLRSQVAPLSDHPADDAILPPEVLARLLRPVEVVLGP